MKNHSQPAVHNGLKGLLPHLAALSGLPNWSFDGQQTLSHAPARKSTRKTAKRRFLPVFGSIGRIARKLQQWIADEIQFRANIRELRSLNDHALRDIGLNRGDIAALASRVHSVEELNVEREELARPLCPVVPLSSVKEATKTFSKDGGKPQLLDNAA